MGNIMRKILLGISLVFLVILTACQSSVVNHPTRETPTEEEQIELINQLKNSTVALHGYYMDLETALGSGMIFMRQDSPNGKYYYYVVTNQHVVEGSTRMNVVTEYDRVEIGDIYSTSLTEDTPAHEDIAIIRFESDFEYPVIEIIPYENPDTVLKVSIGQTVFGIGSPTSKDNFNLVTNYGVISDFGSRWITHTININPGNSGGPLFSYDGTFIGINTQRVEVINDRIIYLISESIDANQVADMIQVRLNAVTPKLGIQVVDIEKFLLLDEEDKYEFDPEDHVNPLIDGIVVLDVGSTRSSYGILEMYDVIIEVNGKAVTSVTDFTTAISPIKLGDVFEMVVSRKHETLPIYEEVDVVVTITHA